jgi:hypothetical protein
VLDAALAQLRQRAQARAVDAPPFIPAARFTGRKQGYFFSRGREGVGYAAVTTFSDALSRRRQRSGALGICLQL